MAVGKSFSFLKAKTETFLTQLLTMQNNFESIEEAIAVATGDTFQSIGESSLSGGCINQASKISGKDGRDFFVKRNSLDFLPFFEAEGRALREIASTRTIKVPETITHGTTSNHSFIVLDFIQEGVSSSKSQEDMGRQLADLHRIQQNHFGWSMDNCIGATPQPNPPTNRWIDFYRNIDLNTNSSWPTQKELPSPVPMNYWTNSRYSSPIMSHFLRCYTEIYGEAMHPTTKMGNLSFLIQPVTTEIEKRI